MDIRIGQGYDAHIFGEGDSVALGGTRIPYSRGIEAHSDGDVVLHALCDAIYGSIGEGDIGTHFPPNDEQWRDCPSIVFLEDARNRLSTAGFTVGNVDITIIAEAPKIAPHRAKMIEIISKTLNIAANRVAIKATTNEKMGAIGRGEGLAAFATVLVQGD